jgi:toxin ParE1/3/4
VGNYLISNKANRDLNSIWEYTFETWTEKQADRYYDKLIRAFRMIAEDQQAGKSYSHVEYDLYGFGMGKHIIFYRILDIQTVEITRILHQRMDIDYHLSPE